MGRKSILCNTFTRASSINDFSLNQGPECVILKGHQKIESKIPGGIYRFALGFCKNIKKRTETLYQSFSPFMANPVDIDTVDDAPCRVQEWVQCTRILASSFTMPLILRIHNSLWNYSQPTATFSNTILHVLLRARHSDLSLTISILLPFFFNVSTFLIFGAALTTCGI